MRAVVIALLVFCAAPAAAQNSAAPSPELTRAAHALAAIWRPVAGDLTEAAMRTACTGAVEEMAAIDAALPSTLTPDTLARVRALHGLLIVPGEAPAEAYFFPPPALDWFRSGLGRISVLSEAEGFIAVRDAAGRDIAFQLGRAGTRPLLRIRPPEGDILTFVGCAPVA